jgi:Phospholipase_D-nuclease N-terminal/Short C-terminal domain
LFTLATNYPFLNILWTMIIFFAWVAWIWIAVTVFIDIFRRRDASGWVKAAWVVFVIVLPFVGVLVYLIANHDGMAERSAKTAQAETEQFDTYVRDVAGGSATEISKAKQLLDAGTINQEEFDQIKRKALAAA